MSASEGARAPSVLIVYYTYTQQALKVAEAMADRLRERGCDVKLAKIELTDERWAERFTRFPLKHPYGDVLGMLGAQLRGATGEIQIPEEAQAGDYDLVVIGSPTWFFKPSVPIRSYLKSDEAGRVLDGTPFAIYVVCRRYWSINMKGVKKLATKRGGTYLDNLHFTYAGKQFRSFLAMMSNFKDGETHEKKILGVTIPPTNLQVGYHEQAHVFADGLVDRLESTATPTDTPALAGT